VTAVFLVLSAFLRERGRSSSMALTIVPSAGGLTRGWRSARIGVGAADGRAQRCGLSAAARGPALTLVPDRRAAARRRRAPARVRPPVAAPRRSCGRAVSRRCTTRRSRSRTRSRRRGRRRGRSARPRLVRIHALLQRVFPRGDEVAFIVLTFGARRGASARGRRRRRALLLVVVVGLLVRAPLRARARERDQVRGWDDAHDLSASFWSVGALGARLGGGDGRRAARSCSCSCSRRPARVCVVARAAPAPRDGCALAEVGSHEALSAASGGTSSSGTTGLGGARRSGSPLARRPPAFRGRPGSFACETHGG
jgi:hypothetical protein